MCQCDQHKKIGGLVSLYSGCVKLGVLVWEIASDRETDEAATDQPWSGQPTIAFAGKGMDSKIGRKEAEAMIFTAISDNLCRMWSRVCSRWRNMGHEMGDNGREADSL